MDPLAVDRAANWPRFSLLEMEDGRSRPFRTFFSTAASLGIFVLVSCVLRGALEVSLCWEINLVGGGFETLRGEEKGLSRNPANARQDFMDRIR